MENILDCFFDDVPTIDVLAGFDIPDLAFEVDGLCSRSEHQIGDLLLNEGGVLKTLWTVYDRQFPDGQREICVSKCVHIKGIMPIQNRAKRGESTKADANQEDSIKRAKQAVRLRCKTIGADRMITLTYRENMQDFDKLKADYDAFRRRMGKHKTFHYVATVERQKRGAYHIHIAVRGRQVYQLIRSIWQNIVGLTDDGKQAGQIDVRDPHKFGFGKQGHHKLASYIAKYISKDAEDHELNKKRYWSSKGIVIPEKNWYTLPYGTTESDAYVHVMRIALDHNSEDLTWFSNTHLGLAWFATAPLPAGKLAAA